MHITNQSFRIQVCKLKSKHTHTEFEWYFFRFEQKVTKHEIVRANEWCVRVCVCVRSQQWNIEKC